MDAANAGCRAASHRVDGPQVSPPSAPPSIESSLSAPTDAASSTERCTSLGTLLSDPGTGSHGDSEPEDEKHPTRRSWILGRQARGARSKPRAGRRFALDVVLGALFVAMMQLFAVQVSVVRGESMEPGLVDGDRIVVDRISYAWMDVGRFDVVVLSYPCDPNVDFVKRIVGLPGDVVEIEHGVVSVNGEPLHRTFQTMPDDASHGPVRVPSGAFFVLGDNRPISCDSREFGLVQAPHVRGKVRMRFWPLSRFEIF